MNEEIMTNETAATEVNENPVVETQETQVTVSDDTKSLAKDLGEMAIVGLVIYAFCKLVDFIIDKAKAGIKKLKEKRVEKKAQKAAAQQQAPAQQGPVATVEKPVEGQTTEAQQ